MKQTMASMEWKTGYPKTSSTRATVWCHEIAIGLLCGAFSLFLFFLVFQNSATFGAELRLDQVLLLTHRAND